MKAYTAIDPGLSGAWAAIDHHGKYLGCWDLHHEGKIIQTNIVWDEIKVATQGHDIEFVIEHVSAMPKQGVEKGHGANEQQERQLEIGAATVAGSAAEAGKARWKGRGAIVG
jgi:hypothetical protein